LLFLCNWCSVHTLFVYCPEIRKKCKLFWTLIASLLNYTSIFVLNILLQFYFFITNNFSLFWLALIVNSLQLNNIQIKCKSIHNFRFPSLTTKNNFAIILFYPHCVLKCGYLF
jgi:hypothetical protein